MKYSPEETENNIPKHISLGHITISTKGTSELTHHEIRDILKNHAMLNWGCVGQNTRLDNELALAKKGILVSLHKAKNGNKYAVITDNAHLHTTIQLMP